VSKVTWDGSFVLLGNQSFPLDGLNGEYMVQIERTNGKKLGE
jgi:hypothetical protein